MMTGSFFPLPAEATGAAEGSDDRGMAGCAASPAGAEEAIENCGEGIAVDSGLDAAAGLGGVTVCCMTCAAGFDSFGSTLD
jgi:hypothetical protein